MYHIYLRVTNQAKYEESGVILLCTCRWVCHSKACPIDNWRTLAPTEVGYDKHIRPFDFEVSRSKVKITVTFNAKKLVWSITTEHFIQTTRTRLALHPPKWALPYITCFSMKLPYLHWCFIDSVFLFQYYRESGWAIESPTIWGGPGN